MAADIVTFNLSCLVYFLGDVARQARLSTLAKGARLVGILLIGAPVFLAYLGLRKA